jgi:hypothetical protein
MFGPYRHNFQTDAGVPWESAAIDRRLTYAEGARASQSAKKMPANSSTANGRKVEAVPKSASNANPPPRASTSTTTKTTNRRSQRSEEKSSRQDAAIATLVVVELPGINGPAFLFSWPAPFQAGPNSSPGERGFLIAFCVVSGATLAICARKSMLQREARSCIQRRSRC